jgi:hypothetical protein
MTRRSLEEIFGGSTPKRSLEEIFGAKSPKMSLSDEQQTEIDARNKAYEEKYSNPFIESDLVRKPVALMQGISNASLNPFGYIARAAGEDTKPLQAKDAIERGLEKSGEYGYDAAMLATAGNIAKGAGRLGSGNTVRSAVAQEILAPEVLGATAAAAGGGLLEGALNPRNDFERALSNIVGSFAPAAVGGAISKNVQAIKGGFENVLSNNKAVRSTSKGIRLSDDIANRVYDEAPAVKNTLNERAFEALDNATGARVDIDKKLDIAGSNYGQYMDMEGFKPINANPLNPQNWSKYQKGIWEKAINEADMMTNHSRGTIAHTNEIKKYIGKEYGAELAKPSSNKVGALKQLKNEIDGIMSRDSGVKKLDEQYAQAKRVEEMYKLGQAAKPNTKAPEFKTLDEKQAWVKGVQDRLTADIQTDKNFAKTVRNAENILKKGMGKEEHRQLMSKVNRINKEYNRAESLGNKAARKIDAPVTGDRPFWREALESVGSKIGTVVDKTTGLVTRRADIREANAYLDPLAEKIVTREGLKGATKKGSAAIARQILIDRLNAE